MAPHSDPRGGTLLLDRRFRGVGRIKRASGTDNPSVFRKINRMLTTLHDEGRLDLLRAIRDGVLTPMQVYEAYRRRALAALPLGQTAGPLAETMRTWAAAYDCSEHYRKTIRTTTRYLEEAAPKALVADVAHVLEGLRPTLGKAAPASFNHARSHCLAFVRSTLKRSHPLWLEVSAVERVQVESSRRHRPLSPDEMRDVFPAPRSDDVDAIAWGMVTTGMHAKEYWGRWSVEREPLRVHVEGGKHAHRRRDIPFIWSPAAPAMHQRTFENKVRARFQEHGITATVYDLRRSYANWLEAAAITRTRRKLYMGHAKQDTTDLYERHEVEEHLAADAVRLSVFAGLSHEKSHDLRVVQVTAAAV